MTETTQTPAAQLEHFHKLLKQFHTAMLVTHAGGGQLRARPMAVARVEADNQIWFLSGADTAKTHEIETDTHVHLVCQNDRSAYLSINGRASLVHDRAKLEEIWSEPYKVWFPGGKDDPHLVLISVTPEDGEYWDNEGFNKVKYLLDSAKAYATGKTPQIQEGQQHGRVDL